MSLLAYEDARPWARAIEREVLAGRMPPWFADPEHGQFSNDARLSVEDRDAILEWVRSGAAVGDPPREPPVVELYENWRIGTPDLIIEMPEPFVVPANGEVDYVYVRLPLPDQEDRWVQSVEVDPGQPAVIHHVDVFLCRRGCEDFERLPIGVPSFLPLPENAAPRNQDDAGEYFGLDIELLFSYLPGGDAWILPPGRGRLLPGGGELLFNLHYSPNGREVSDRTRVGMVFSDEPPAERVLTIGVDNETLWIPAGASEHHAGARVVISEPLSLLALTPHMHLRGRSFAFDAVFPNGDRNRLLSVPEWDFNWQLTYILREPMRLPAGTEVVFQAVFDNSATNRFNPDPSRNVPWGRQVTDEMMTAWVEVAFPVSQDPETLLERANAP